MLGNCEKMVLISSASNEWSQQNNQIIDDQKGGSLNNNNSNSNMANSAAAATATAGVGGRVMDQKVAAAIAQEHQQKQQNQEPLRCPRCDSTNTKFCYYNNYSLSQPRHFCKACKRYWTRGGTLRSVPVGGGCRKNKRVSRRPPNTSSSSTTSLTNNSASSSLEASANSASSGGMSPLPSGGHIHDLISSASYPLFYGMPTNHNLGSDINFPFSRYDLQNPHHQINGLGLGFSSGGLVHGGNGDGEYRNGFNFNNLHNHLSNSKHFQDLISSNHLLSTTNSTSPSISSLLAASLQIKGANNFQTLLPSYGDDLHMKGSGQSSGPGGMFMKEVKMELEGQNRSLNHHWSAPSQNHQMDHNMGSSSDPSLLWGNGPNLGAWLDPSNNLGSSVPSLI